MSLVGNTLGLTDRGNAHRVARFAGERLRWAPPIGWLAWNGKWWETVDDSQVIANAVEPMLDDLKKEVFETLEDNARKAHLSWCAKSESSGRLTAAANLAKGLLRSDWKEWDQAKTDWLLNVNNGTLDLRTGEIGTPDPLHRITHYIDVKYDPRATDREHDDYPRRWMAFIDWMTQGDKEKARYLQQWAGYCLSGNTNQQKLTILHGQGSNGKGVFARAMMDLMGDLALAGAGGLIMKQSRAEHQTQLWSMRGKRLVIVSETEDDGRLDEERVKMLTGEDDVPARAMYKDQSAFRMTAKLMVLTNPKPVVSNGHSIWRRLMLVPCGAKREDHEAEEMRVVLAPEMPGILAWAVQGAMDMYQARRLTAAKSMLEATQDYRSDMDSFGTWIEERCVTGATHYEESSSLYASYRAFIIARGEFPYSQRRWASELGERKFTPRRGTGGVRVWGGLRSRFNQENPDPF